VKQIAVVMIPTQVVALDHGTHGPVENEDAFGCQVAQQATARSGVSGVGVHEKTRTAVS
jgi:hypothetical protein